MSWLEEAEERSGQGAARKGKEVNISLEEVISGVTAMAQYTAENGDLPREVIAKAFQDGLRAALLTRQMLDHRN
jgi:hypothetical protein